MNLWQSMADFQPIPEIQVAEVAVVEALAVSAKCHSWRQITLSGTLRCSADSLTCTNLGYYRYSQRIASV